MSAILSSLFSIWSKLKRWKSTLSKWVLHELTENKKNLCFEVLSSFTLRNHKESFLDRIVMIDEKWILYDNWWRPEKAPKHFPKSNLHPPKKSHSHCLVVCCWSDPLQLAESQWNQYIWEACSVNRCDVPKTAMPAASIGQQDGPNSFPWQHQLHVIQPTLQNWTNCATKFCLIRRIHLTSHQLTTTSFNYLDNFLQGKCFHNQQEAENAFQEFIESQGTYFYSTGINKLLIGKNVLIVMVPILINKAVFEPSYIDLKITVRNCNYVCHIKKKSGKEFDFREGGKLGLKVVVKRGFSFMCNMLVLRK